MLCANVFSSRFLMMGQFFVAILVIFLGYSAVLKNAFAEIKLVEMHGELIEVHLPLGACIADETVW